MCMLTVTLCMLTVTLRKVVILSLLSLHSYLMLDFN